MKAILSFGLVGLLLLLQGCSQYLGQPLRTNKARLGAETPQYEELVALPAPKEKIIAAVYKFRDQTGQYKDTEVGSSWSTAVTQGATSILLRSMEESGWFIPIEREGLTNLLNERKIIRSSMANYNEKESNQLLPPLIFAGVIMEGGIISFDSNVLTGGVGARYFGAGGSTEYREDRVTIYLRAVSTSNGRILKTVYTSKTILSQQVDVGIFRFVSTRRLLEVETGFTYNEPGEMAVKEAIEKAVFSLIVEGIKDKLWMVKDETDTASALVKDYVSEKESNKETNVFGQRMIPRRAPFGVGLRGAVSVFEGDYTGNQALPAGEVNLEFNSNQSFSFGLNTGVFQGGRGDEFNVKIGYSDLGVKYKFFNFMRTTPYLRLGAGIATEIENSTDPSIKMFDVTYPQVAGEFGMEYMLKNKVGINGSISNHLFFSDEVDGLQYGKYDDSMWVVNLGVMIYLFK